MSKQRAPGAGTPGSGPGPSQLLALTTENRSRPPHPDAHVDDKRSPPAGAPLSSSARKQRTQSASPRSKNSHLSFRDDSETNFIVGIQRIPPQAPVGSGRILRETQVMRPTLAGSSDTTPATQLSFANFLGTCSGSGKVTSWHTPPAHIPPSPASAAPLFSNTFLEGTKSTFQTSTLHGKDDQASRLAHNDFASGAPLTSHSAQAASGSAQFDGPPTLVSADPEIIRSVAIAAACALHGARLVEAVQNPAVSVLVAAHGDKNSRTPLSKLAQIGVDASLLLDKSTARVALRVCFPHGNTSLIPVVPIVELGQPNDGLFFLRPGVRVVGLALVSYKNSKWDGLYDVSDFPDSELSVIFGAGWMRAKKPDSVAALVAYPKTPPAGNPSAEQRSVRRLKQHTCTRSRGNMEPFVRPMGSLLEDNLGSMGFAQASAADGPASVGSKRKASAFPVREHVSEINVIPKALLLQLRSIAPVLLAAAQNPSSTTLVAWPHPMGTNVHVGNLVPLCDLACNGMTIDQFAVNFSLLDIKALTLVRTRVGNSKARTGAFPVVPIFSSESLSHMPIICANRGQNVVDIGVLFKRRGDLWKTNATAIPIRYVHVFLICRFPLPFLYD